MKIKTYILFTLFFLFISVVGSKVFAQCPGLDIDTLSLVNFESGIPEDWEAQSPSDGGSWKIDGGKIGYYANPGQGKWLYLSDEEFDNIGQAVLLSPDFDLSGYGGEVFFEMDVLFQAFEDSSFMKVEVWNGRDWIELLLLEEDFVGRMQFDLSGIQHRAVQLRFTYDDEGTWAWGMGLDNLILYAIPTSCGNGICDPGESPENCDDCQQLTHPAPFWIEPGKDIQGHAVTYTDFNHKSACDDCSQELPIGFTFTFFDQPYSKLFLNANGNLTFERDFVEYTPSPFCLQGPRMIAPFFGDVDLTRGGNIRYYHDPSRQYMVIHWDEVAYYGCESGCTSRNSFQVILTDGSIRQINGNPLPEHTSVIFNYGDMEWTTGSSSGGTDGLGGSAATVGMNLGDEVICIDYGTFDAEGYGYRGNTQELNCPPNEVSHLDYRSIALDGENGNLLVETNEIPEMDTLVLGYTSQKTSNLFFWEMEDSSFTSEFVLLRGDDHSRLYEILRKTPVAAYNPDSGRFEMKDLLPLDDHIFYLLKEIRVNGEENVSEIIRLNAIEDPTDKIPKPGFELNFVGPNPFKEYLSITYTNPEGLEVQYIMTNQLGQPLAQGSFGNQSGVVQKRLDLPGIQPGKYFLSIYYPGGREGVKLICRN